MDRMLVVVFDSEAQAHEGKNALLLCEAEGSISIYGYAARVKHADKTASIVEGNVVGPIGSLLGTSLGRPDPTLVGTVFRRALAQLQAELRHAQARRHASLQKKVDELTAKLDEHDRAEERREAAAERKERATWKVLRKNAEAAKRAIRQLANTPL